MSTIKFTWLLLFIYIQSFHAQILNNATTTARINSAKKIDTGSSLLAINFMLIIIILSLLLSLCCICWFLLHYVVKSNKNRSELERQVVTLQKVINLQVRTPSAAVNNPIHPQYPDQNTVNKPVQETKDIITLLNAVTSDTLPNPTVYTQTNTESAPTQYIRQTSHPTFYQTSSHSQLNPSPRQQQHIQFQQNSSFYSSPRSASSMAPPVPQSLPSQQMYLQPTYSSHSVQPQMQSLPQQLYLQPNYSSHSVGQLQVTIQQYQHNDTFYPPLTEITTPSANLLSPTDTNTNALSPADTSECTSTEEDTESSGDTNVLSPSDTLALHAAQQSGHSHVFTPSVEDSGDTNALSPSSDAMEYVAMHNEKVNQDLMDMIKGNTLLPIAMDKTIDCDDGELMLRISKILKFQKIDCETKGTSISAVTNQTIVINEGSNTGNFSVEDDEQSVTLSQDSVRL